MQAVIRTYSGEGAGPLFDFLDQRKVDIEALIRAVPGFVGYALIRTADGGVSVTICQDKAGTDASIRIAADWIRQNAPTFGSRPPAVSEGSVILHLS